GGVVAGVGDPGVKGRGYAPYRPGSATPATATATTFSPSPLEAGFGQVDIMLDVAQDVVVDCLVVAQGDHCVAFCFQCFTGQFLKVAREQSPEAFFMRAVLTQLPDTVCIFGAQTFDGFGPSPTR